MAPSLSVTERTILEAVDDAQSAEVPVERLTELVRRSMGRFTGREFREGVARLTIRRLLVAQVMVKEGGEVGRVVILRITPLGRYAIGRARAHRPAVTA